MTDDEFELNDLATYLQLPQQQVEKLATRGQLPARRVGGAWRFSRAEIHHWMEARMGNLDSVELARMEAHLGAGERRDTEIRISRLLQPTSIEIPLLARTRAAVIVRMAQLAEQTGILWDAIRMADAVALREEMQPTALENGVALLHPRRPQASILGDNIISFGISASGVPFGARTLTRMFFLICSVDDRTHLRILARLSRLLANESFLDNLEESTSGEDVIYCVRKFEDEF
jgi:nitrogen PTS system EIIA component